MFNNFRETLLDFSNGIASFLKNSEYFATSVENRANLSNLGSDNLVGCKCFFYEVSAVHNITHSKYLIMPIHQAMLAKLKRCGEKEEYEKNCWHHFYQAMCRQISKLYDNSSNQTWIT